MKYYNQYMTEADAQLNRLRHFEAARRGTELITLSERFAQLQTLTAQPFVHSNITGIQEKTNNNTNYLTGDLALQGLVGIDEGESENSTSSIMGRAFDLCTDIDRIQSLTERLAPVVTGIQSKTIEEIDEYFTQHSMKKMSQPPDRDRAITLEWMLEEHKEINPILEELTSIMATKKILARVWARLHDDSPPDFISQISSFQNGIQNPGEVWKSLDTSGRFKRVLIEIARKNPGILEKYLSVISSPLIRDFFSDADFYPFIWEMPIAERQDNNVLFTELSGINFGPHSPSHYRSFDVPHIHMETDYFMIQDRDSKELILSRDAIDQVKDDLGLWNRKWISLMNIPIPRETAQAVAKEKNPQKTVK